MTLKKVRRVRLFEQAVDQLRALILSGDYEPGDKLPTEQELCDLMDLSRSSVREAMRVLEAEGLIYVRRGSGSYVAPIHDWATSRGEVLRWLAQREETVLQILQVRHSIEGLTASLAAQSDPSNETIKDLEAYIDKQEKLIGNEKEQDIKQVGQLDVAFHVLISELSGNDMAHEIVTHILPAFSEANHALLWMNQGAKKAVSEHKLIVQALRNHDAEAAKLAMQTHIERVRQDLCEHMESLCED